MRVFLFANLLEIPPEEIRTGLGSPPCISAEISSSIHPENPSGISSYVLGNTVC